MTSAVRTASGHAVDEFVEARIPPSRSALPTGPSQPDAIAERYVINVLNELGYVDPQGRELDQRWITSLTEPVLDVLDALGLWRAGGRRRDVPATAAVRAIARLALR